jgi:UDP-N-acetylmuramyl pentapeptide phosphotransferase/UDP-N-acetylglucosamine-1-phosphate transferase
LWFPGLVFSPFVVDATVTLFKRLLRGEKVWQAHREHYYQRLVQMRWGHRNTALVEYLLMLTAGGSAILALELHSFSLMAFGLGWGLAYLALAIWIDRRWAIWQNKHDV